MDNVDFPELESELGRLFLAGKLGEVQVFERRVDGKKLREFRANKTTIARKLAGEQYLWLNRAYLATLGTKPLRAANADPGGASCVPDDPERDASVSAEWLDLQAALPSHLRPVIWSVIVQGNSGAGLEANLCQGLDIIARRLGYFDPPS